MSFTRRALALRLPKTQVRFYADNSTQKGMMEQAGETLKNAADAFKKDGAIGKQFQADGSIGKQGEKVGGPFSSQGAVGKEFTDAGSVGGNVEKAATDVKQTGQNVKQDA